MKHFGVARRVVASRSLVVPIIRKGGGDSSYNILYYTTLEEKY